MHTILWLENMKGRDQSEDVGVVGRILEGVLEKQGWKVLNVCIWLKLGASDGFLWKFLTRLTD
jgi:hypothetical protein